MHYWVWLLVSGLGLLVVIETVVVLYFFSQKREKQAAIDKLSRLLEEHKSAQEQLRASEEEARVAESWARALFDGTKDMVFVFQIDEEGMPGPFLEVNGDACVKLGRTREELLNMSMLDVEAFEAQVASGGMSKADLAVMSDSYMRERYDKMVKRETRQLIDQLVEKGELYAEHVYEEPGGKKIPVETHFRLIQYGDNQLVMCTAKDISTRKATENALTESRQRFRDFFSHSPIGIAIYDAQRDIVDVNAAALKMFGIPDKEQFGRFNMFNNPYMAEDMKRRLDKGESVRDEIIIDFNEAVKMGLMISAKTTVAHFDIILNNMGLGRDFRPRGYFALIQDMTDRRIAENELKKQEDRLRQAEKMEAIGAMAGGIAHDFNNILTPIVGYVKMILRTVKETDPVFKFATGIEKASLRAKDLVAQILTFARKSDKEDSSKLKPIRVIPLAKEVLNMQRQALPPEVEINRLIKTEIDGVRADPTKVHQVLMNLCTNAGHAMRATNGGTLEMVISDFLLDQRSKGEYPELVPGQRYLRISVRDTGTGMDKAVLSRIFEPFFTTKKKGEGTGMGLSVVHGVVSGMKGCLRVDSEVGKGSTFHVILPVAEQGVGDEQENKTDAHIAGGTERILIVDDETEILEMEGHMLSSLGYKPVGAASGQEAYKLFMQDPSQFDMLVVDEVMPGMRGSELATLLRTVKPDLPVVIVIAYEDDITPEKAGEVGCRYMVAKPLAMADFAEAIAKSLGRSAEASPAGAAGAEQAKDGPAPAEGERS